MSTRQISGYVYGTREVSKSPLSLEDLHVLQKTVTLDEKDIRYLRMAGEILADQVEEVLDVWYNCMASQPHLVRYFAGADGRPDTGYLLAVRERFGQWILDTCNRPYDQDWLDYQHEIALRHTSHKNQTDHVQAPPIVHLRYIIALICPIVTSIRPFLARSGYSAEDVDNMVQAWFKAVTLQVALWCQPYVKEGMY